MRVLLKDPDNNSDLFAVEVTSVSVDYDTQEVVLTSRDFDNILVKVGSGDLNDIPRSIFRDGSLDLSQFPSYWDDTPVVSAE